MQVSRSFLPHGLPAVMQPEPFLGVTAHVILDALRQDLRRPADVLALVLCLLDEDRILHDQRVEAVRIAMHERGKIGTPWKRAIEAAPGTQFVGLPKKSSTMPLRRFVS